jgi:hypothetical protein
MYALADKMYVKKVRRTGMRQNIIVILISLTFLAGCNVEVNQSIDTGDDAQIKHDLTTVNGSIRIGKRSKVDGDCRAVNGNIGLDDQAQARDLNTINGRVELGRNVEIRGDIVTINGSIESGPGSVITGELSTINGQIDLRGTEVRQDLYTLSGDVFLREESVIRGDILVQKKGMINDSSNRLYLTIRISGGSVVEGNVIVKDKEREVTVDLREGGKVLGEIRNARIEK